MKQFEYINNAYGLNLTKHCPVESRGKRGQVVKSDGAHIYIQWDGEPKPIGPYHPTSELSYPSMKKSSKLTADKDGIKCNGDVVISKCEEANMI